LPRAGLPRLASGLPLLVSPRVVRAGRDVPDHLPRAHRVGRRHCDPGADREPHAALSSPGERRPHDPEGEVLGHLPLPDLLAPGGARRLGRAVDARPYRALRGREDRPNLAALLTRAPRAPCRLTSPTPEA